MGDTAKKRLEYTSITSFLNNQHCLDIQIIGNWNATENSQIYTKQNQVSISRKPVFILLYISKDKQ